MKLFSFFFVLLAPLLLSAQQHRTGTWGDQGNGTYINPVLNADYSDPDVIRVGNKYYMVCSEFHFMGMPVLESEDMVNWHIIGQVYSKIDFPGYDNADRYGAGSWAPSIRYHDGKYWVYFCTKDEGLFMSNAVNPAGPWSPLLLVKQVKDWEDPCPFWDEDGNAYLGHSRLGAGPIILHKMSADGTRLLDEGTTIYNGPTAEGTKFYKLNGYYYLSIPEGGVGSGWQTILRSANLYGPYERKIVLEKGSTAINGPHQGALVATPGGQWWFYHFQDAGAMGRVLHLQPVTWVDNWPMIGVDIDRNGIGEPVAVWTKPATGTPTVISAPQTDDDFNTTTLGLQWEFNHNPVPDAWSLQEKAGWLTLQALPAADFMKAKNTLTQKIMGSTSQAAVQLDISDMQDGQKAGIGTMSNNYHLIGIHQKEGKHYLFFDDNGTVATETLLKGNTVYLRVQLDMATGKNQFYYSTDNKNYTSFGSTFEARQGHWKASKLALFSYNETKHAGKVYVNWFSYQYDGPK